MWWGVRDPGSRMTEHDRLLLLALGRHEADLCECGHPRSESMDPKFDKDDPEGEGGYFADAPIRCFACTARDEAQHAYAKDLGADRQHLLHGLRWTTELQLRRRRPQTA